MAPPINVQDWYGDGHTCQIASGALVYALWDIIVVNQVGVSSILLPNSRVLKQTYEGCLR